MGLSRVALNVVGWGTAATTGSFFWATRHCTIKPIPPTDYIFQNTLYARSNPNESPVSQDVCVRTVPLNKIKPELLSQEGRLVEAFCAGIWGGVGYAYQRRFLEKKYRGPSTAQMLWDRSALKADRYEIGTIVTDHFQVVSKTPESVIMRCGDSPRNDAPVRESDGLFEMVAEVDERAGVAKFSLKSVFYNGLSGKAPPLNSTLQWLHAQYDKLLMETSLRGNVML
ncbi:hypothetical protein K470DRAFT_257661 [Piedraia hortae CBS 480.64]|uniref:Uncharacterized protein n=1 Tax=Piedraia hortae CBS 480.64 TaxID=1314780 RepID=A0A6A7C014_9PEZI|nr:hypothetical protein K470DRAFT_257661 [Piedraia hortae CBS 480.64]